MKSATQNSLLSMGFCIALCLGMQGVAHAAPTISGLNGTATHGSTVTVSGSGFGSHASFNNIGDTWKGSSFLNFRFKDFEDGVVKSDGFFPQRGGEEYNPPSNELGVFDGGPRNSGKFLKRVFVSDERGGISAKPQGAGNQLYTTFKFMQPSNNQSGKLFRFYADSPQNNVYLASGCQQFAARGFSECSGGGCSNIVTEFGKNELAPGVWHRVEVLADSDQRKLTVTVDGVMAWQKTTWLASSLGLNGHTIDYPNMIDSSSRSASCPAVGSYNFDDIFVDFTQARVELGDAPTWSGTRKREVQLASTWSSGAITFKMNTGEFAPGQTVYLYVVDSTGAVNANGVSMTLGNTATSKVPNAPGDFRAN